MRLLAQQLIIWGSRLAMVCENKKLDDFFVENWNLFMVSSVYIRGHHSRELSRIPASKPGYGLSMGPADTLCL